MAPFLTSGDGSENQWAGSPFTDFWDHGLFSIVENIAFCLMASFLTSGDFSEINGREALSDNSGAMAPEPSFNISLFASSMAFLGAWRSAAPPHSTLFIIIYSG